MASSSHANPELEALLEPIRAKYSIPAMAGAVFGKDGMIAEAAIGVRKAGTDVKVTEDDVWHLGSDTKSMTATLAGTFVAEGKLSWDDSMEKCFPEFAATLDPSLAKVTVSQLLSHRAGLIPNLKWNKFDKLPMMEARRKAAEELLTQPPESKIGEFIYSNAGYVVVGAILEKLGGKPWEELLTTRVFQPLNITSSGFGGVGTPGQIDQPWGHRNLWGPVRKNGPESDNPAVMGPAGTVHMKMDDWCKYLADQALGGGGQKALLPADVYTQIQSKHPAEGRYGYGWGVLDRPWSGGKTLTHNGSNTMNFSVCWVSIPRTFGVAICINRSSDEDETASDEAASALIGWYLRTIYHKR